jgi:hypothetical protein
MKNKKRKINEKNYNKEQKMSRYLGYVTGYRTKGMPHNLVKQFDKLDLEEFTIALEYSMNHFNFTKERDSTLVNDSAGAAYDERRYPNAQYKPSGRRFKANGRYVHITVKRNQALAFACKTLSELHRQARLTSNVAVSASSRTATQTKFERLFAATYKEACDIDPYGYETFLEEIPRDNSENYLLRVQRKTADKHTRSWGQNTNLPRMYKKMKNQDPRTYNPIDNYPQKLHITSRQYEMVTSLPKANEGPRHHRCYMATGPPTPSLINRLFGPTTTNANAHEVMQGDQEANENERNERRSITVSDTTENIRD